MNRANVSARKYPSIISQCKIPPSKDIAGSTEKLKTKYVQAYTMIQLPLLTVFHEQKMLFVRQHVLELCMRTHDMLPCGQLNSHRQTPPDLADTGLSERHNELFFH